MEESAGIPLATAAVCPLDVSLRSRYGRGHIGEGLRKSPSIVVSSHPGRAALPPFRHFNRIIFIFVGFSSTPSASKVKEYLGQGFPGGHGSVRVLPPCGNFAAFSGLLSRFTGARARASSVCRRTDCDADALLAHAAHLDCEWAWADLEADAFADAVTVVRAGVPGRLEGGSVLQDVDPAMAR